MVDTIVRMVWTSWAASLKIMKYPNISGELEISLEMLDQFQPCIA